MFKLWDVIDIEPNPIYIVKTRGQIQDNKSEHDTWKIFFFNPSSARHEKCPVSGKFLEQYCSLVDTAYQVGDKVIVQYPGIEQPLSSELKLKQIKLPPFGGRPPIFFSKGRIGTITKIFLRGYTPLKVEEPFTTIVVKFEKDPKEQILNDFNLVKVDPSSPIKREDKGGLWLL